MSKVDNILYFLDFCPITCERPYILFDRFYMRFYICKYDRFEALDNISLMWPLNLSNLELHPKSQYTPPQRIIFLSLSILQHYYFRSSYMIFGQDSWDYMSLSQERYQGSFIFPSLQLLIKKKSQSKHIAL